MKTQAETWGEHVMYLQKLFPTFRKIFVHNMFSPYSEKRRASDKDLPVSNLRVLFIVRKNYKTKKVQLLFDDQIFSIKTWTGHNYRHS